MKKLPDSFVFMKIGNHAGETFDQILKRKNLEFEKTGMIFWGYGGAACHPINQVQPFVKMELAKHKSIYLVMHSVKSNASQDMIRAEEYSIDGVNWSPIPEEINVTGSRYAIVLDEIQPMNLTVDLNHYDIGIGPSRGKTASEYLRARTDKGCLVRNEKKDTEKMDEDDARGTIRKVDFAAKIKEPYAVLLR
ncbi:MAG: hypothetical protein HF312_18855 [Ignavibacteria bacterium]|jgi:hypothetical protein|nr:hypothetical protein [Ignavibacteria bacterium]MCU7522283.1 hypothetical protein [Ignavibacteria bacterium]